MPEGNESNASLLEQLLAHTLDPFGVVMLSRDRIQETLEDAVRRGRVTRSDANELAGELLRRGRAQTEELLDRARRTVTPGAAPIPGYDELTARQVQARLGDLSAGQLRAVADYERRHANRKTVLDAVNRALGD
jgi:hypothetical protein